MEQLATMGYAFGSCQTLLTASSRALGFGGVFNFQLKFSSSCTAEVPEPWWVSVIWTFHLTTAASNSLDYW